MRRPAEIYKWQALAERAAILAGEWIATSEPQHLNYKPGSSLASQVVTEVDQHAETLILNLLRPSAEEVGFGILSEEAGEDGSRHRADYFWCIDPLDGTLPFVEKVPGYAVSVALVDTDGTPWIGVAFDPLRNILYSAVRGEGLRVEGGTWVETEAQSLLSVFYDRSFMQDEKISLVNASLEKFALSQGLGGIDVHVGAGAVMNAIGVLEASPACYFKFPKINGGGHVWDFAATACILEEGGGIVCDIFGGRLDLNQRDGSRLNRKGVLFASDAQLAEQVKSLYRQLCT